MAGELITLQHPKNTALKLIFPITDADGGSIVTSAAGLDSEKSQDGAGFGDCTNEATEIGSSGWYTLTLTAAELNYSQVAVKVISSTSGAWPVRFLILLSLPMAELGVAKPSATPTPEQAQMLAYMALRNKTVTDANLLEIYNDAGTVIAQAALSDDSVDFIKDELASG